MANLRVDKITSTETFERTGSVQFDGSTSNIRAGWVDDYNYLHHGTEDWTAEFWVYPQLVNSRQTIFSTGGNSSSHGFTVRIMEQGVSGSSNGYYVSAQMSRGAGGNYIYWSSDPKKLESDTWYHIAVVFRSSNKSLEIYVDGELTNGKGDTGYVEGTFTTYSGSNAHSGLILGLEPYNSALKLKGFISNFRIVRGKLVYTENFKVPMKELEDIPGTTLLCCQSKYSAAAAKVSPFISGVNDGTVWSDAQDVTNGTRLRHTDFGDSSIQDAAKVFDARDDTDAETPNGASTKLIFDFETLLGKKIPVSSSIKIKIGGSDGRTLKVNGTTIATNAGPTESVITNQSTLNKVEVASEGGARSGRLTYIKVDDVSLTLPVLPFGKVVHSELSPGLLTDKVVDGGSSAIKGSVEFPGSQGSYLTVPNDTDLRLADSDFTIEFWATISKVDSTYSAFALFENSSALRSYQLEVRANGAVRFEWWYNGLNSYNITTGTGVITVNQWNHYAASRNGATLKLFINGVEVGSSDVGTNSFFNNTVTPFIIGGMFQSDAHEQRWQGNISNLRVVKGTALYTHNFIPPTRELKKIPGTVLLCCQDPDNPLTEATGKTITGYGDLQRADGVELVSNGSFASSLDNWTASGVQFSHTTNTVGSNTSGKLMYYATGTNTSRNIYQDVPTVSGARYVLSFYSSSDTASANTIDIAGTSVYTLEDNNNSNLVRTEVEFTAASSTTRIRFTSTVSNRAYLDKVSVTLAEGSNKGSNFTPQVGDNRKVTFEGVTKINSDAYFYLPTGDTASRETTGTYNAGTRGLWGGGQLKSDNSASDVIDYVTVASKGDALDFGDLTQVRRWVFGAVASSTRGVWAGGLSPLTDTIDFVTIATKGDALDFGNQLDSKATYAGVGNEIRGIFGGGNPEASASKTDGIDYITIASKGNSQDFGNLLQATASLCGTASPTRGLFFGGYTPTVINTIQYVTIASTGNAKDFGDLSRSNTQEAMACANAIRGICAGGGPSATNAIEFVTISTMGNAFDFGDLVNPGVSTMGALASSTRGLISTNDTTELDIEMIEILTTGNAVDYGDLSVARDIGSGCSNGHGGLG